MRHILLPCHFQTLGKLRHRWLRLSCPESQFVNNATLFNPDKLSSKNSVLTLHFLILMMVEFCSFTQHCEALMTEVRWRKTILRRDSLNTECKNIFLRPLGKLEAYISAVVLISLQSNPKNSNVRIYLSLLATCLLIFYWIFL